jgi:hypothetical protein
MEVLKSTICYLQSGKYKGKTYMKSGLESQAN